MDEPIHLSPYDVQLARVFRGRGTAHLAGTPARDCDPTHWEYVSSRTVGEADHRHHAGHGGFPQRRRGSIGIGRYRYEDFGEAEFQAASIFAGDSTAAFNIALVPHQGPPWVSNLALRDYLRGNPEAKHEYAEIKRSAPQSGIHSLLAYSDCKGVVVSRLLNQACRTDFC